MRYKFKESDYIDIFNIRVAIEGILHNAEIGFAGDDYEHFGTIPVLIYFKASVWNSSLIKAFV